MSEQGPSPLPNGFDAADAVREGWSREAIEAFVTDAEPVVAVEGKPDKYVRTFAEVVAEHGGPDGFWDFTRQEGIPTPFPRLTRALGGGLRQGEVYVIGGNQGSGKTSLALQFLLNALRDRKGVLLFSMEMAHRDVFQRICGILASVDLLEFRDLQKQRRAQEYAELRHKLAAAGAELEGVSLLVSTKSSVTPEFIVAESERLKDRQRVDLIAVDHLQLMGTTGTTRGDYEKFTAISRALKHVAMELRVPVLLVSQTSRSNASDRRTELEVHDLRGSGAIEEDAAAVMLIYPDASDRARHTKSDSYAKGPVRSWLKVGKNRYGLQGACLPLMHLKSITQFAETDNHPR
jgi:replicative DNA helicase